MPPPRRTKWISVCCAFFFFSLLICKLCSGPAYAQVQPQTASEPENILILHSHEASAPVFIGTDKGLLTTLESGGIPRLNQSFKSLDLRQNPGPEYRRLLVEEMRVRYSRRKPDMIITMYPEALEFVLKDCRAILPDAPILALYLPLSFKLPEANRRIIGHSALPDINGTLEIALKLVPGAKRVYVVSGAHEVDRRYENLARRDFEKWEGRLELRYLSGVPFEDMLAATSTAPPDSIIFLLTYSQDVTGKFYTSLSVSQRLSQVSTAPIFGLLDAALGHGIVGGSLINFERIGTKAGELALDILRGTRTPENIREFLDVSPVPMFDWRQLRHWNLSEADLPTGSIVINREFSLWDFKYYILGGLALIVGQSLLIAGLTIQRRRRRLAEESLSRAEEKYRNIFDSALEGIYETSPQGQLLTANRALAKMLGYDSPEEVISSIRDTANKVWADPNGRADYLRLLDAQNVIRGFECQFLRKDGTKFWVSLNTRRVTGPDGQTLFYSGFLEDVTARKQAEEILKERLNFEMLMAEISALFVNLPADRIDSEIEAAQHRVCEFLDLDRSSLFQADEKDPGTLLLTHLYQPPGNRIPPERMSLNELFPWVFPKVLGGETITISKMTDLPAEAGRDLQTFGLYGTRSVVAAPLAVGRRGVFGLLTFAVMREEREWTETVVKDFQLIAQVFANALVRKSTEESLRQKTEELDQFFSLTLDLLCIASTDGYFLRLNPAWERILGYSRKELTARRFFDFIHPDDLVGTREAISELAAQQELIHFENRYRCKDGTYRWMEWTAAPAGELIYAAARDITERLKSEAEARQRREELAHVARIATMGELTASLAHEINQPLAAIRSNAEAAQRFLSGTVPDISEVRQILDDIIRDDRRAGKVVQKVRDLVRKEKPLQEFLDLNRAIQEVFALVRSESLLQGLSIHMELSPDLKMIRGDRVQLQQVILNLILNGSAAMKNSPQAQRRIIVRTAMPDNGTVKASVTDFGTGIDENNIELLFEPFYTTKPEGLGMGLSICERIITAHGGILKAENNPQGGATFAFTLPAHQGDAP